MTETIHVLHLPHRRTLSPADRSRFDRTSKASKKVTDADRRFFERFPHRSFRIRRMSRSEKEQALVLTGCPFESTDPQAAAFTLVKQIKPGYRLRLFIPGPVDSDGGDVPEWMCAHLWESYTSKHSQHAAVERAILAKATDRGPA